jgi:hypothetical protein
MITQETIITVEANLTARFPAHRNRCAMVRVQSGRWYDLLAEGEALPHPGDELVLPSTNFGTVHASKDGGTTVWRE